MITWDRGLMYLDLVLRLLRFTPIRVKFMGLFADINFMIAEISRLCDSTLSSCILIHTIVASPFA
jgi:hypothetical protein